MSTLLAWRPLVVAVALLVGGAPRIARGQSAPRATAPVALPSGRTWQTTAPMPGLASRADYVPAERYNEIRALVTRMRAEGGELFIAPDQQTSYMVLRRTTESEVEEHSRWDDILIVRAGTGSIELGARTTGARMAAPGELRGGRITTPRRMVLRPGDVARIPAGVPHAFVPSGSEPWEMLVVKVRRPNKPLKRVPGAGR